MQKNIGLIAAVVVIILLLLGGGFYLMNSKSQKTVSVSPTPTAVAKEKAPETNSITGTLKEIFTGGKTQTCTITYPDNTGSGTIFVSGKKFGGAARG